MKIKTIAIIVASTLTSLCYADMNNKVHSIYEDGTDIAIQKDSSATVRSYKNNVDIAEILIADSDENKISHNKYDRFNVDEYGIILNNHNAKANYIINEVINGATTSLKGNIAVEGPAAHVVIANPNGISCSGCHFSNTLSETLATASIRISQDNSIIYNTANFLPSFNFYRIKKINTAHFGKINFTNTEIDYINPKFNHLNIISNNIDIDMRLMSKGDINIYNGINVVEHKLATNKFDLTYSEKGSRLSGKYVDKNLIIGKGNEKIKGISNDYGLFAKKINIHTNNSAINNYSLIQSQKINLKLENGSSFNNQSVIAGNSSLIKLQNRSHFKNMPTGVMGNIRTDDYQFSRSTDPFVRYSMLHRVTIHADDSSSFTNLGALKTNRYLTLNKTTHNIFTQDASVHSYNKFLKVREKEEIK